MANPNQAVVHSGGAAWYVVLETNQLGSWDPVANLEDVVFTEFAPASGPDSTTTSMRATVINDPGGSKSYSWVRTGQSTRITANSPTASSTGFSIDAGSYDSVKANFDCQVTIDGVTRQAATDGEVFFDGTA